jgi:predicted Zn-dependent peptidase
MSVQVTTLENGLRVATDDMPGLESTAVGVWVDVGARHETREENGISHLLEHMAFKGTERRSARAIAEEIESVGGHLNAYTSREQTCYYARVLKDDLELGVDILSDILQHPTFDPEELAREREVVVQEIGQSEDTPDDLVFDRLQEVCYPDQPIGRSILGTADGVRGFDRNVLSGYMGQHYRAPGMVLAASGRIDHDTLVALARAKFGNLRAGMNGKVVPARFTGGDQREARDLEQVHVCLAFDGVAYDDPDFYPLQIFSTLFGGGMSSRLFQEVREQRGLCYSVFSFAAAYHDGGMFGIYAGTGAKEVAELVPVVCDELVKVGSTLDEAEVARARAQAKAGILMALESPTGRAEQLARHLLIYGRPLSTDELKARVDAVDSTAIRRVAERVARSKPAVAALGPIAQLEAYERIAARLG